MRHNRHLLLALASLFLSFYSNAQLDSTSVSVAIAEDTINNLQMAIVTVHLDDAADLGMINIVVYDDLTGGVVAELVKTREELITSGNLLSDRIEYPLFSVFEGNSYRIEASPVNLEGAYTTISSYTLTY